MLSYFRWLGKKDELAFAKQEFRGKLAGKSWKYEQNLDGLVRTRLIIFFMSIFILYPVLSNYVFHGVFSGDLLFERLIFSVILIFSGLIFNKFRIVSIILGMIPIMLILIIYLLIPGQFGVWRFGFMGAILCLIGAGFYHNKNIKQLRKELEATLLENQLIDSNSGD